MATTSGAAGAVWLPFRVGPPGRAVEWARRTREELARIATDFPEAGVDLVDAFIVPESPDELPVVGPRGRSAHANRAHLAPLASRSR